MADLGFLVGLQGGKEDMVVVEPCGNDGGLREAAEARKAALLARGFAPEGLPEVVDLATALARGGAWAPYGCWPAAELGPVHSARGAAWLPLHGKRWAAERCRAWRKDFGQELAATRMLRPLSEDAVVCTTEEEVFDAIAGFNQGGWPAAFVKAEHGWAGQSNRRARDGEAHTATHFGRWVRKRLGEGPVLVEPEYDRVLDFSLQLDVSEAKDVSVFSRHVFRTDGRGNFLGAELGSWEDAWASLLGEEAVPVGDLVTWSVASTVGRALAAAGYVGPAGVDGFLFRAEGRLHLHPVCDVNPRQTITRLAHLVARRAPKDLEVQSLRLLNRRRAEDLAARLGEEGVLPEELAAEYDLPCAPGLRAVPLTPLGHAGASRGLAALLLAREARPPKPAKHQVLPSYEDVDLEFLGDPKQRNEVSHAAPHSGRDDGHGRHILPLHLHAVQQQLQQQQQPRPVPDHRDGRLHGRAVGDGGRGEHPHAGDGAASGVPAFDRGQGHLWPAQHPQQVARPLDASKRRTSTGVRSVTFAEAVLRGGSLEAKLAPPVSGAEEVPAEPEDIAWPNRDEEIAICQGLKRGGDQLPKMSQLLASQEARVQALQKFANHELQAIEMFAWALARFPEAPRSLRRGLLRTLREEQQHCQLYLDRAAANGADPRQPLGCAPVSGYLWQGLEAVRAAEHPLCAFLCGVGLTFEAANLDHTLRYRDIFRQAGDEASAKVLQRVHDEEVQHVRLARLWVKRLAKDLGAKGTELEDLALYQRFCGPPAFGLCKARGKGFPALAARRKAGLSEELIAAVKSARSERRVAEKWALATREFGIMGCGASAEETQKKKPSPEDRVKDKKAAKDENRAYQAQLQFLEHVPLMKRLPKDQHPLVASVCEGAEFKRGDTVIRQGENGQEFYVIRQGEASVYVADDKTGEMKKVAGLKAGDYFGEKALLRDEPRTATIKAESTTLSALKITRKAFQDLGLHEKLQFANRRAVGGGGGQQQKAKTPTAKSQEDIALITEALRGNENLATMTTLDEGRVKAFVDVMWKEEVKEGQRIIQEGDLNADYFYVVESGRFEIFVQETEEGGTSAEHALTRSDNKVLNVVSQGGSFGELALLYFVPRAATVQAITDGVLWVIDRSNFKDILMKVSDNKLKEYIKYLNEVSILDTLLETEKKALAKALVEMHFTQGEMVVQQDEPGNTFYIMYEGNVDIMKDGATVANLEASTSRGTAQFFGEKALLENEKRGATVLVKSKTAKCLVLDRESFDILLGPLSDIIKGQRNKKDMVPGQSEGDICRGKIKRHDLQRIGLLGCGGFGTVELWEHKGSGDTYALKGLSKGYIIKTGMQDSVMNEKNILMMTNSSFITKLWETYNGTQTLYFLLESCLGGELYATYNRKGFHGIEKHARYYSAGVTFAFEHLHARRIIYRDLKPENLLLTETGHIKLTDMGLAKFVIGKTFTSCGTPDYFAPELIASTGHTNAVDWWTLGVLIFELMCGHPPFESAYPMQIYAKVTKGIAKVPFPAQCNAACKSLIEGLLQQDPSQRLPMRPGGIKNLMNHKWFAELDWEAMRSLSLPVPYKPVVKNRRDLANFSARKEDAPRQGWGPDGTETLVKEVTTVPG
ncbi:unnamed protein product [Effrenium voratum]|uniref:cGMP-dependent protein kinase n=1 Tax=Effrenium voratum TaxID=2562239 RepID=A0AA36IKT9_9DINO|nr:unnamed protein product [Effrenium voratum]